MSMSCVALAEKRLAVKAALPWLIEPLSTIRLSAPMGVPVD
jgi:Arc/MetJ family transcription regulator